MAARAECLRELTHDALDAGITRLILDQTDVEQARRDRATIREVIAKESADLEYFHVDASTYGGLQAADVIAWAYGAGGDWRRRLGPIVQRVRDLRT